MAIIVTCSCGKRLSVSGEKRRAKCPSCGGIVNVPEPSKAQADPLASADVYGLQDTEPSAPATSRLEGILATHCGWCNQPLNAGSIKCEKCGWTAQPRKKATSQETVVALAELEMRRASAANSPPDPPSWLRILLGPFNPLRVIIPAIGISLEIILFGIFFGGIGGLFIWLGRPDMVALVMIFATCLLFGHTVRRMFQIVSWAAAKRKWEAGLVSDFITLVYAILVLVIGVGPFVFVFRLAAADLRSALQAREIPQLEIPIAAGLIASLLWALYYVPMAFTATGATYRYTLMPWTVIRWMWKCWPHMTLCLLLLPVYTAITCGAVLTGAGYAALAIDPSLQEEVETIREWWEPHLEKLRDDPEHIREINAEIARELRQRRADFDIDDPNLQRTLTYLLVGLWACYFVLIYPAVALYHMLGLIVCRREPSIGWWEERADG